MFDICSHTRVSMLQDSVDIISNWTTDNDMCINASKTKEMIINLCFCRDEAHEASLSCIIIDGNAIDSVRQAKFLGVTISADLKSRYRPNEKMLLITV